MTIDVFPHHFTERADAIAELQARGLHYSEAERSLQQTTPEPHDHSVYFEIYLLSGVLELADVDAGVMHRLEAGWKAVVPAHTRHAEFSPAGYSAVFASTADAH